MMYSTQRDLRKKMFMARATQGTHDNENNNLEVCKRLINLRREMAQLLGYKTYADFVMKYRMASNVSNVYKLLDDLIDAYKPTALKEQEAGGTGKEDGRQRLRDDAVGWRVLFA